MTSKERVLRILNRRDVDRSAFWCGSPEANALRKYLEAAGLDSFAGLSEFLGDDLVWIPGEAAPYNSPDGRRAFDVKTGEKKGEFNKEHPFAGIEDADEIPCLPPARYFDFEVL